MKMPNGPIMKILIGALIAIAVPAGGYVANRAVTSTNEEQVRQIMMDKLEPIQEKLRDNSSKLDKVHDQQIENTILLKQINGKL